MLGVFKFVLRYRFFFFRRKVLESHKSTGIGDLGGVKWDLALCLFAVYLIVFLSLWRGIKASGKVVWVTATLPYVCLIVLLIRGVTLEGAIDGIIFYLDPKWELLLNPGVRIILCFIFYIYILCIQYLVRGLIPRGWIIWSDSWSFAWTTESKLSIPVFWLVRDDVCQLHPRHITSDQSNTICTSLHINIDQMKLLYPMKSLVLLCQMTPLVLKDHRHCNGPLHWD